ncbi:hypothetical protein FLP10_10725 [Agromyces intestinalis]|uniref:Hydrogenase maturation nickel metallochaperone HypA n=1 Tax=Agromyces intestinalis TaxID=2592652 RepID=A0A5C1YI93_9MICO|nr:DUF6510 family protein [Agromyces intestinalis]QEO14829.1 hypothetical protein FLP10_10725 [Agromyces intestinalis]
MTEHHRTAHPAPHVDGNALAGPLAELFAFDVTDAVARCGSCGTADVVARAMVYRSAVGTVVRCPACDDVLATLVESDDRIWFSMRGMSAIEVRRR